MWRKKVEEIIILIMLNVQYQIHWTQCTVYKKHCGHIISFDFATGYRSREGKGGIFTMLDSSWVIWCDAVSKGCFFSRRKGIYYDN